MPEANVRFKTWLRNRCPIAEAGFESLLASVTMPMATLSACPLYQQGLCMTSSISSR